jgi:hypothetical protein
MGRELLATVVERTPLVGHDGLSGAALERVRLADGRRLVVKRVAPATDLTLRLTGGRVSWEYRLWKSGALAGLPAGVGHPIVDAWTEDDVTVIVMRDLGDAVLTWDRRLDHDECAWVMKRVAGVHRAFIEDPPESVAPLPPVLELFSPRRIRSAAAGGNRLCAAALRGWEYFADPALVPADVSGPVLQLLEHSGPLVLALLARPVTLVHADLATVNMAILGDELVLLDWSMPVIAPGAVDVGRLMIGCAHVLAPSKDELLAMYRVAAGATYDTIAMRLALLAALVWLGWNKTLDIVEATEESVRARERADLAWWVRTVRDTLESGAV